MVKIITKFCKQGINRHSAIIYYSIISNMTFLFIDEIFLLTFVFFFAVYIS